jgi:hypothetical protein
MLSFRTSVPRCLHIFLLSPWWFGLHTLSIHGTRRRGNNLPVIFAAELKCVPRRNCAAILHTAPMTIRTQNPRRFQETSMSASQKWTKLGACTSLRVIAVMLEAVSSSETSVNIYQTTRRNSHLENCGVYSVLWACSNLIRLPQETNWNLVYPTYNMVIYEMPGRNRGFESRWGPECLCVVV